MASKNSVKQYAADSFYHIYNRGVEKRNIFIDSQDYAVFLSYLKTYLSLKDEKRLFKILSDSKSSPSDKDKALKLLKLKNYCSQVQLISYALLPNHFHLLLRQKDTVLDAFMNSVGTRYAMYFNRKYRRKGVLFQDVYKAVLVNSDEQLLHLSRYIHLNPVRASGLSVEHWEKVSFPCSLPEYLGKRQTLWIAKEYILDYFSKVNLQATYENFLGLPFEAEPIQDIAIDLEDD